MTSLPGGVVAKATMRQPGSLPDAGGGPSSLIIRPLTLNEACEYADSAVYEVRVLYCLECSADLRAPLGKQLIARPSRCPLCSSGAVLSELTTTPRVVLSPSDSTPVRIPAWIGVDGARNAGIRPSARASAVEAVWQWAREQFEIPLFIDVDWLAWLYQRAGESRTTAWSLAVSSFSSFLPR